MAIIITYISISEGGAIMVNTRDIRYEIALLSAQIVTQLIILLLHFVCYYYGLMEYIVIYVFCSLEIYFLGAFKKGLIDLKSKNSYNFNVV